MRIEIGVYAGFCDGVKNAVEKSFYHALKTKETIYVDGELIHNPQTLKLLAESAVVTYTDDMDISLLDNKKVIIRAHGIPPSRLLKLKAHAKEVLNLTCKYVAYAQAIVKKYSGLNYRVVIIGKAKHPEVIGLMGFAKDEGYVVIEEEDIDNLPNEEKNTLVISQTTMQKEVFDKLSKMVVAKYSKSDVVVKNTICEATSQRQDETKLLAERNDAVLVIGGKESSNTKRLYEIASKITDAFYVETKEDLRDIDFSQYDKVAITAGASTPDWVIEDIANTLRNIDRKGFDKFKNIVMQFFIYNNLFFTIGSFLMSFLVSDILGLKFVYQIGLITACYYFVMSAMNHYTNDFLSVSNNIQYEYFMKTKKVMLAAVSFSSMLMVFLAFSLGRDILILTLFSFILGVAYNLGFKKEGGNGRYFAFSVLKKLASFKAIIIAFAVTILLVGSYVIFYNTSIYSLEVLFSSSFIFLIMFMRQVYFEIKTAQSDKISGTKSMLSFISYGALVLIFAFLPILFFTLTLIGILTGYIPLSKAKYLFPLAYLCVLSAVMRNKNILRSRYLFAFLIDSPLYAVGLAAIL